MSVLVNNSTLPTRNDLVAKIPVQIEGIEKEALEEMLTQIYRKAVESRGIEFQDITETEVEAKIQKVAEWMTGSPVRSGLIFQGTIGSGKTILTYAFRIREAWEKMRPEKRYGQMTPKERVAFMLSDEDLNYLFPFAITVDGKSYEQMVTGRVARVFAEESEETAKSYSQEESNNIFKTAFLLFANLVDAATTFAQNCGGGGSAPDKDWGRDANEDDILWARRCFRKAGEMVASPLRRRGMRR